jgi:hypothetical protein
MHIKVNPKRIKGIEVGPVKVAPRGNIGVKKFISLENNFSVFTRERLFLPEIGNGKVKGATPKL